MKAKHLPKVGTLAAPVRSPRKPKNDRQVECPACGKPVIPRSDGYLRKHRSPRGVECFNRLVDLRVGPQLLNEIPEVVIPRPPRPPSGRRKPADKLQTLVRTGYCHGCNRPVGPDRLFCGPCAVEKHS